MKHPPDRRAPLRREERWLRRGMRAIVTLTLILLAVTIVGVSTTLTNREQQVARAEVVLEQLQAVTDQLDRQAARLAEAQAETAASRTQFREAIRMLLDALDVADGDPFTDVPTPD